MRRPAPPLVALLVGAALLAPAATARAAGSTVSDDAPLQADGDKAKKPYRGSLLTLRSAGAAIGLDPGAELTHNPSFALDFAMAPRVWIGDVAYVAMRLSLSRELTNSDSTTLRGETVPSDLLLRFGAARFVTIPGVDIGVSGTLDLVFPFSPVSRGRTLQLALRPGLSLSRRFDVLSGLSLGYGFRFSKRFHRYTTGEREAPLVRGCVASAGGCDAYLNNGLRNTEWRLEHLMSAGVDFTSWFGLAVSVVLVQDFLYPMEADERVSLVSQEPQDERFAAAYEVELTFRPMASLEVGLGTSTVNPQLAPDSTYYAPFFNRFTEVYLDLRLDIAGLVSQIEGDG